MKLVQSTTLDADKRLAEPIVVPANWGKVVLDGRGHELFYGGPPEQPAIQVGANTALVLRDVTIRTTTGHVGISLSQSHHSVLDNVTVEKFSDFGLLADNAYYCAYRDCQFRSNDVGAKLIVGNVSEFRGCHFQYNRVGTIDAARTDGCTWEGQDEDGCLFTTPHANVVLRNGYFEQNCKRNWVRDKRRLAGAAGLADVRALAPTLLHLDGANWFANTFSDPATDETSAATHNLAGAFHSICVTGANRFFRSAKWKNVAVGATCTVVDNSVGNRLADLR